MKVDKLYLGNIVTMNEIKPYAEALTVKDGLVQYVGSEDIARSMCDENTEVIDLKGNTIYPGFLEAHCHPMSAGKTLDTDSVCNVSDGQCLEDYVAIMAEFIKKHPGKKGYTGAGFMERDVKPHHSMIDAICSDVPVIIGTTDGHSMWMNAKAMEKYGINKDAVKKYGEDLVRVDENGEPTGYISENPVFDTRKQIPLEMEDGLRYLRNAQNFFLSKGYTAVYEAGVELSDKNAAEVYVESIKQGDLKLRVYAGSIIDENCEDIEGAIQGIVEKQKKYNNEYFKIIGVKTFSDGVVEAHTGLLLDDYNDQPGYKGVYRMTDHNKLVRIYKGAAENNMNVHVHTVGDRAIRVNLDAMEEAAKLTGKMDQRNALVHLQIVDKNDFKRFADLNVVAGTAPLWSPKHPDYFKQEVEYVGEKRAEAAYPVKSFFEAGAATVYHTDYPVSKLVDIAECIFEAEKRRRSDSGDDTVRKSNEFVNRYQSLCAMTKNVAYMWHEENRLGTLEVGKIANMSVFTKDFLKDDIDDLPNARLVCTIIDGNIVYKA